MLSLPFSLNVVVDVIGEKAGHAVGDRPRGTSESLLADGDARLHLPRGGRDENLVGRVDVLLGNRLLRGGDPRLRGDLQENLARYPAQAPGAAGRGDNPLMPDAKDVR